MDILGILEQFGLPVAMLCAFGYYIWRQNLWIQNDLTKDLHTKFNNIHSVVDSDLRMILIKLIDQQKKIQIELRGIIKSYQSLVDILSKLMNITYHIQKIELKI